MNLESKIFVAGHRGMVGSAIMRQLNQLGYNNLVTKPSAELDLRDQKSVNDFFVNECPNVVFLAAAKVGGIYANNTYRAQFLYDNLMIQSNVIHAAHKVNVNKLLFLGSSCIYPKFANQPIEELSLLTGTLEQTNEPYAIAKITGIKLCENYFRQYGDNFISVMPTNLYGTNDNYDLENSHVLPALIRKFCTAKKEGLPSVNIWGTGNPMREFLHVDDLARACLFIMNNMDATQLYSDLKKTHINIGSGKEITIKELAYLIKDITGFDGLIEFDISKPDGTPRKLLDSSLTQSLGWYPSIQLKDGIKKTVDEYITNM